MYYRTIFISDVHLGTSDCHATELLDFIKENESHTLYLVGDIIDGWEIKRRWKWNQEHSDVIQKLLRKARKGTMVRYILGNHDEFLRPFLPMMLGDNFEILNEDIYTAKNGERFLVVHGDIFDSITMTKKWLALLGDRSYSFLLKVNKPLNSLRRLLGYNKHWSFSKYMKKNVKQAVQFIDDYENALSTYAKEHSVAGIICGHIHEPEIKMMGGITYINCGDWVESCSAVVETIEGEWKILHFHKEPSLPEL